MLLLVPKDHRSSINGPQYVDRNTRSELSFRLQVYKCDMYGFLAGSKVFTPSDSVYYQLSEPSPKVATSRQV